MTENPSETQWSASGLICCDSAEGLAAHGVTDAVFAIGTFDGLHLGHRAVIDAMLEESRRWNAVPAVLTFDPHPRAILTPDNVPPRLMSRERKLSILASLGVKAVVTLPFTREFAALSPDEFLSRCLLSGKTAIRAVCVGSRWRFGACGKGDVQLLADRAKQFGFVCRAVSEIQIDGAVVSSTLIRAALTRGDVSDAAAGLGRRPAVSGVVVHGYGVANTVLHCATANVEVRNGLLPANGVYAAFAVVDGRSYPSVVNIGTAPTFDSYGNGGKVRVEVHLLTQEAPDLYGKEMAIGFAARIRGEKKFDSPAQLEKRIAEDVRTASGILSQEENTTH